MDFETFGENIWADTGIFDFVERLIYGWLRQDDCLFVTVSQAADFEQPVAELSMPNPVTWADTERDLSAWLGNDMQNECEELLYQLLPAVRNAGGDIYDDWRRLSTSDHAYYMSTKYWNDGDVHAYFSPFDSPYDAFLSYINVIRDLDYRLKKSQNSI